MKNKTSNIMLVVSVLMITIYVGLNFVSLLKVGSCLDSSITVSFFTFWTGEIFALAGIKITKVKHGNSTDDVDNTDDLDTFDYNYDEDTDESGDLG